ncbi:MAG: metalloregulator ArsR/SmtB family transcription factor [Tepidisphaeraceae bacterium]|jgi:DNA-binding transcriptional ArsR family regulator
MSLLDAMALDQELDQLVSLFRLLSDKTRLNVLLSLARGERNVSSLCEELGLPQPTVSHHLGLLRGNNVIANRRQGKQVFYSLHPGVTLVDESTLEIVAANVVVKISHLGKSVNFTAHHPENIVP